MSIPIQGKYFSRSAGVWSAIAKQLKFVNFKPVSKITVQFDPFEKEAEYARKVAFFLSAPKLQLTNLSCTLKTKVVCDRSSAVINCDLNTGEKVVIQCANLQPLDILKLYNKHISSLVPKEEPAETGIQRKKKKKKLKQKVPRHRR